MVANKIRILFVDDEANVLNGLRRSFRKMRDEWDMAFAQGGDEALAKLEENRCEVVVSDMRMPGMNGAEFLGEVAKRYPETVRFVLSGYADRDMILACTGIAHQYLSKPCEPETLREALRRVMRAEGAIKSIRVRQMVKGLKHLPVIPSVYSEFVEEAKNPDSGVDEISEIVGRDLGISANLLKVTNSAFFGIGRPVTTVADAVAFLGLDTVKQLVLSIGVFQQFSGQKDPGFSSTELWRHSTETAAIAKTIASLEAPGSDIPGEAFLAGMIHDVGKLVLGANFGEEYKDVLQIISSEGVAANEAEMRVFGVDHADVGGYLLGLWAFPESVVEAITFHHHPSRSTQRRFGALAAVHAADAIQHEVRKGDEAENGELVDKSYLTEIQKINNLELWRARAMT